MFTNIYEKKIFISIKIELYLDLHFIRYYIKFIFTYQLKLLDQLVNLRWYKSPCIVISASIRIKLLSQSIIYNILCTY